jgi:K+-sensing histidine kinase KdpD
MRLANGGRIYSKAFVVLFDCSFLHGMVYMQLLKTLGQRTRGTLVEPGALRRFAASLLAGPWPYRQERRGTGYEVQSLRPGEPDPTAAVDLTASQRLRESILMALSHDLRGPLTSVVGLGESLLRSTPALVESQAELARAMRDEALRMSEMVSNLLDILRIQSTDVALKQEWNMLEEIVGSALRITSQQLKQCSITTQVPSDFPLIRFDAVLVERVLANLIENATKYAGPGAHIGIAVVMREDWAEVSVYDNGPGIPIKDEQFLFERFSRCASSSGKPGHGLGLSICRAIVEAHGGTIRASPSPYHGAGFTFSLPLEFRFAKP